MLNKRIIPCLDVKDGRVVKGVNFVSLKDAGDPVDCARAYDQAGADELVFLDITASVEDRKIFADVVRKTAECVFMPLTVGGGISNVIDIRNLLNAGADKVSMNTSAVSIPVIASGGAGTLEHFYQVFAEAGADAALAASVFHYGEISIPEVKTFLKQKK